MVKIEEGFILFQPWADDVVKGKLKYLVRSISTTKRKRVAVISSSGVDPYWFWKASDEDLLKIENKIGAIGSVIIKDCIEVNMKNLKEKIINLAGEKYFNYYPKYLFPVNSKKNVAYIWILTEAKEWKNPIPVNTGGITWSKVDLGGRK